jgi:hypothetical protein
MWAFQQGGGFAGDGTSLAPSAVDPEGLARWLAAKGEASLTLNAHQWTLLELISRGALRLLTLKIGTWRV